MRTFTVSNIFVVGTECHVGVNGIAHLREHSPSMLIIAGIITLYRGPNCQVRHTETTRLLRPRPQRRNIVRMGEYVCSAHWIHNVRGVWTDY